MVLLEVLADPVEEAAQVMQLIPVLVEAMVLLEEKVRVETMVEPVKARLLVSLVKNLAIYILEAEAVVVTLVLPAPEVQEAARMEVVLPRAVLLLPIPAAVVAVVDKELLLVVQEALALSLFVI